ncbi:hypothetical protein cyc_06722 [Cyclospora cayetanensis]|uniref:Uncharacterized protein n=1 Tax=Cyclospora cayetanensis TaxID=88456 RepID=A0A1D3D1H0_9EIME|nr:hypothetical protein cyc_06722 [Cyclospora cayetanensis]
MTDEAVEGVHDGTLISTVSLGVACKCSLGLPVLVFFSVKEKHFHSFYAAKMSRTLDSRGSSAQFMTPRGLSLEDSETNIGVLKRFQSGAKVQKEAPGEEHRQEVEEQAFSSAAFPGDTAALTQAVMQQLQQSPSPTEDLSQMIGENEWQRLPAKTPSWNYTRALSSYTGFTAKRPDTAPQEEDIHKQASGVQLQNSGIFVEGISQWNAATNSPVRPLRKESKHVWLVYVQFSFLEYIELIFLESRKFTLDAKSGDYVNAHNPSERMDAKSLNELTKALSKASVKETVVDVMRRRSTLRKMTIVSKVFLNMQKKELSSISIYQDIQPDELHGTTDLSEEVSLMLRLKQGRLLRLTGQDIAEQQK